MKQLTRGALAAAALVFSVNTGLVAQDGPRVSGTVTLTPSERIQVLTSRRMRLGVVVQMVAGPTDSIGALIVGVTPNGPASRAGIRSGDIVVRFNGKLVTEGDAPSDDPERSVPGVRLIKLALGINPGDSVVVQYRRGKTQRVATVVAGDEPNSTWSYRTNGQLYSGSGILTPQPLVSGTRPGRRLDLEIRNDSMFFSSDSLALGPMITRLQRPMPQAFLMGSPLANLELAPVNAELGRYFGTPEGVLVINLPEDSKLGLKPGDVVLSVDGRDIRSPGHLINVLLSYGPDEKVTLRIMRQKTRQSVSGTVEQQ